MEFGEADVVIVSNKVYIKNSKYFNCFLLNALILRNTRKKKYFNYMEEIEYG